MLISHLFTIWRIYSQVDWEVRYAFITTGDTICFIFDFLPDFIEIHKLPAFAMQKFTIFWK